MILELMKEFKFEASHILPKHPGKCSRLHGHSWVLRVFVKGEVNEVTGFVMDYVDIKKVVQPIVDSLDHRHLGTFQGDFGELPIAWRAPTGSAFYPSSENLIVWIANQLWPLDLYLITEGTEAPYIYLNDLKPGQLIHTDAPYITSPLQIISWSKIELDETCTSRCTLMRRDYHGL